MSRFQFAWFRRWRKWIALAAVAFTLPIAVFLVLNRQRRAALDDLAAVGVTARPQAPPWLAQALAQYGKSPYDLPSLFWSIDRSRPIDVLIDRPLGGTVTPDEMRRAIEALNSFAGADTIRFRVSGSDLPPELLRPLTDLEGLRRFELVGHKVKMVPLDELAECPQLQELSLRWHRFDAEETVTQLAGLPHLKGLAVYGGVYDIDDVRQIARLDRLRTLCLDNSSPLDAHDLAPLANLPRLERLSLVDSTRQMETIDGSFERFLIPTFQSLRALKELRIGTRGGFPAERVTALRAAIPDVKVVVIDTRTAPQQPW